MLVRKHPIGLQFDKCGYPKIKDGHNSLIGRMLCQRKEERLKLDEITLINGIFSFKRINCSICTKGGDEQNTKGEGYNNQNNNNNNQKQRQEGGFDYRIVVLVGFIAVVFLAILKR